MFHIKTVMTSHFRWYASDAETVIPPQASYKFPTEASKSEKMTPRIPPKNGGKFSPGDTIRLEFPAQGYVNTRNTTLEFDLTLYGETTKTLRFQNDIHSIFSRVRILYGGTPLEDIIDYNHIHRALGEWTGTNQQGVMDQTSISDGIGGEVMGIGADGLFHGHVNVRQKYIQGLVDTTAPTVAANFTGGLSWSKVGDSEWDPQGGSNTFRVTRRYVVQLGAGLLNQAKFIPTKWMASQFAIEATLAQATDCIYQPTAVAATTATYVVSNVNLIPEILQFDPSYDEAFLAGLNANGIPIPFASWHRYGFVTSGMNVSLNIQEKSRSVKSIFTVQKNPQTSVLTDSGACLFDTAPDGLSTLQTFQYRIGGRYFPASPVQTSQNGGSISNGGAEAYVELAKALNTLGDARLSTSLNTTTWALQNPGTGVLLDRDYSYSIGSIASATGVPTLTKVEATAFNAFCGTLPSQQFAMAINLETTNGVEISGLNAEEQV